MFNINTWGNRSDQHHQCICNSCSRKVRHLQARTRHYKVPENRPINWQPNSRTNECKVCKPFSDHSLLLKGKPCKTKRQFSSPTATSDLPFSITVENVFSAFATQNSTGDISPHLDFLGQRDEHSMFTSTICQCTISLPSVQTPCEHYFSSS